MNNDAPAQQPGREFVTGLYDAAVAAAAAGPVTTRAVESLSIDPASRVWVFAIGKAAVPMAAAAVTALLRSLHAIVGGVVVPNDASPAPYPTLITVRGDHPIPGGNSFAAATKVGEIAAGRRSTDVVLVLLSGGASSLLGAPLRGMNESDLTALYELLLGSGLNIADTNAVRKRFSRWGAGRLALALAPAAIHCLAISDVAGDDLSVIGSGPCTPDVTTVQDVAAILERAKLIGKIPRTHRDYLAAVARGAIPETPNASHPAFAHVASRVIGNNQLAVDGAAAHAREAGWATDVSDDRLDGSAATAGERIAQELLKAREIRGIGKPGRCLIWGGETTVSLDGGDADPTDGGRCQELALAAARILHDAGDAASGITLLAAGTDGRDGMTDASGAVIDASTWQRIADGGGDPARALATHRSNGALRTAGALLPQRDTQTNVNDVVIGIV